MYIYACMCACVCLCMYDAAEKGRDEKSLSDKVEATRVSDAFDVCMYIDT